MRKILSIIMACLVAGGYAGAQESSTGDISADVYYLMPDFAQGTVYFKDKAPAQGKLNICAVDHTLRFLDEGGQELAAEDIGNVTRVVIDGVAFIRANGFFYRMYPVSFETGVALRRSVRIVKDGKPSAYGGTNYTSSITEYAAFYSPDGGMHLLNQDKKFPYNVSEMLFLYNGNDVLVFNKKNLRKIFPQKKDEIDRYFKTGSIPSEVDAALELLKCWSE